MPRLCTVCHSEHHVAVDEGLIQGRTPASLAGIYGLGQDSIRRHQKQHLSRALTAVKAKREASEERRAEGLADRLESLIRKIEALVETSAQEGAAGQMLAASRELRSCYELAAKLDGTLSDRTQVTVNVLSSPETTMLMQALIGALEPWPEARIAASNAIDAVGVEVGNV